MERHLEHLILFYLQFNFELDSDRKLTYFDMCQILILMYFFILFVVAQENNKKNIRFKSV